MSGWSIGIYTGDSPLRLQPGREGANPVLTAGDVTDFPAAFVADPFLLQAGGEWHMFFEVLRSEDRKGVIGWATSPDGLRWRYRRVVLEEPFHLSYPHVFVADGEVYMTPETLEPAALRLYRADPFPERWSYVQPLVEVRGADPTPFRFQDRWWMFACTRAYEHDTLALYHAEELHGPWREHPASPVVAWDARAARPAGRVLLHEGKVIRFAQDCVPRYGTSVRAFEVTRLTMAEYGEAERPESPVLRPAGAGWNGQRMHHMDAHPLPGGRFIACVDGYRAEAEVEEAAPADEPGTLVGGTYRPEEKP